MKKIILSFVLLLFSLSFLAGERIVYYKNPHTSLPIVITRSADIDYFDYTYYILNRYKQPVVASERNPREARKDDFRERFFTSVEDYRREKRIIIEWNYKDDKEKESSPVLKDGTYELHIIETNKFQKSIKREYVYYIVLDSISPRVEARLSPVEIKKNNKDFALIDINKDSIARSWRIFLDDKLIKEENYPYGDERRFPVNYLKYEDYMHLPYGEHTLTIIAKDTAMNSTEHRVHFSLVEAKKSFSIFSNKEVLFRKDGNVMPLYCTAIGNVISKNWSCIISDKMGRVHYKDSVNFLTAGYCKGFKWDGKSQTTNERVPLGIYTLSISCSDSLGGTYTQRQEFVVNEDAVNSYLVQEADDSKQLSVDSLPLRYSFKDGKFYFAMKGYQGKVEEAKLKIKRGNEVFFECEVEDAQNIV